MDDYGHPNGSSVWFAIGIVIVVVVVSLALLWWAL